MMKLKNIISKIFIYTFLSIIAFMSIFPFYWLVVGSTNNTTDITKGKMTFGNELITNFKKLMEMSNIEVAFVNTVKITVFTTLLALFVTSLAAYGFEKFKSPGKERVYTVFLLSMMIPFASIMIPLFRLMVKLNLLDSHLAVIIPAIATPFLIFFFRQSFKAFPTEIVEAARIDGAGEFRIFWRIVIPAMKSTYAAAAIYAFMAQWNNYLWPLIILQSEEQKTLTLVISSLSSAYFVDYGMLMLGIVIATLPIIIIFLTMQKQFVKGMIGSSK